MLVHGLLDRGSSFDRAVSHLGGAELITYDRRGCHDSTELGVPARGLHDHADDLIAILERTSGARTRPSVIVGHSFGGQVAVMAAMRRPDLVRGVGTFETAQAWEDWWPEPHRSRVRDSNPPTRDSSGSSDPVVAARRAVELATSSSDKASIATAPYDLSGLDLPLVIGWATSSMASAVDGYRELARRLQLRTVEIVGAGHMAHRTHPEEFAGFVRTVLSTAAA